MTIHYLYIIIHTIWTNLYEICVNRCSQLVSLTHSHAATNVTIEFYCDVSQNSSYYIYIARHNAVHEIRIFCTHSRRWPYTHSSKQVPLHLKCWTEFRIGKILSSHVITRSQPLNDFHLAAWKSEFHIAAWKSEDGCLCSYSCREVECKERTTNGHGPLR